MTIDKNYFKNKKVLVFGLGLLGGGVATTNWLIKHGAKVTVTDLKSENYLEPSLRRLKGKPKLKLNGHDKKDIEDNDIVIFNPDVSVKNPFVKYAQKLGKQVENEATIFYKLCPKPIIAVTGTRGKTTTTNWVGHFLGGKYSAVVSGNSYVEPLLRTLDRAKQYDYVANEIPSYHLEYWTSDIPSPEVVLITNLYQDHLNRHGTMKNYALAKAAIFKNQSANQNLVLNYDNKWTPFFLKQKPYGQIWFFSTQTLPKTKDGVFYRNRMIYFQKNGARKVAVRPGDFAGKWGEHNLENLLASVLAGHLAGLPWDKIQRRIKTLPQIPFRQEIIYENERLKIINDTSATSPDGGIAAIERFDGSSTILIAGGTDRQLDYKEWARVVKRKIKLDNLILLEGSATQKMINDLRFKVYDLRIKKTLKECFREAIKTAGKYSKSVILFSPAAKSFEKFKNEFDRGQQFNKLLRSLTKNQLARN